MHPGLALALDKLRRGDLAGARSEAEAASRRHPRVGPLRAFAGMLAARSGDPAGAAGHFEAALAADPSDLASRINLATALVASGALERAGAVCSAGPADPKLLRLAAYVHQQQGRLAEAAAAYDAVLAAFPDDFESWNNLGNVRAALGDTEGAIAALQQAIAVQPGVPDMYVNLSEQLSRAERFPQRRDLMRRAAAQFPGHAGIQGELGLAEASVNDFEAAVRAYREAIRLDPGSTAAWLDLALLYESLNRIDDLAALADAADRLGLRQPEMAFVKAWALRRQGRFEEALPYAEATPESVHPVRRFQLIAEIYDRLGDAPKAFEAYSRMNRAALATKPAPPGPSFREAVAANAKLLTPARVAAWTGLASPAGASPVFIVGFPRSGTTLLDTLLMNVPSLHVLEEPPMMRIIAESLGTEAPLASLDDDQAEALRRLYLAELDKISPPPPGSRVVDKNPLLMARAALIHRLFPQAKLVFVERHPCDSLLSCFMANFQVGGAMRGFADLEEAARTYDAVFDAWSRAEALLPLRVHRVRYERMVEDLEREMRPLLEFLELPWDPRVLDNQGSAARREHIPTASYSQVTEPIYTRSRGRWERYRAQLEPVLPLLAPWAERMNYLI